MAHETHILCDSPGSLPFAARYVHGKSVITIIKHTYGELN